MKTQLQNEMMNCSLFLAFGLIIRFGRLENLNLGPPVDSVISDHSPLLTLFLFTFQESSAGGLEPRE